MRKDPTPQDAAQLLAQNGATPQDYVLFRQDDESPWWICRVRADGGLEPFTVEDEELMDLCRMVLLTEGARRFASVQALQDALGRA